MNQSDFKIFPLGDCALTIDFGTEINARSNEFAISLSDLITKNRFEGIVECAPAYSSITVFYKPAIISAGGESAFAKVAKLVSKLVPTASALKKSEPNKIEIPVDFSARNAPDLEFVGSHNGIGPEEVIDIFLSGTYRVYMLGFLPGFPYLGKIEETIAAPRLETPRLKVPKGSVGIAGRQTGIYPFDSPGGWRLIGHTDTELFFPGDEDPTLLSPGDIVNFVRV